MLKYKPKSGELYGNGFVDIIYYFNSVSSLAG